MSPDLQLSNLVQYSWQLVAMIAMGTALPVLFRLREPRSHLLHLQLLLAASLLLPWLQPWMQPVTILPRLSLPAASVAGGSVVTSGADFEWQGYVLLVLLAGTATRLGWLALGLTTLRRYRKDAQPLALPAIDDAASATGTSVRVAQSATVPGPVTFGFWRPLVLLPPSVAALHGDAQFAVVAHELLHVRRADWLYVLAEELVLAALWWHPAIWLLVARIRLIREQVIDQEVLKLTASPQPYVQALLTLAQLHAAPSLAPNFLRRPQLAVRIQNLLTEVTMSRSRLFATYSLIIALVTATAYMSTTTFPLQAAPQFSEGNSGVTGADVVLRKAAVYPSLAKQKRIEGTVMVEVTLAENGSVADARVMSGPQELRRAALESVLQWQFKNGTVAQVTFNFTLAPDNGIAGSAPTAKLAAIQIQDASPAVEETLRARLAHLVGQPVNSVEILRVLHEVSPDLTFGLQNDATRGATLTIGKPGQSFPKGEAARLRVGGNVQATKLVVKVPPEYPALAKQAKIQGTVRFQTLIGLDGRVKGLSLESGHPLLVEAAQKAVSQWAYQPTLLNGSPAEVVTMVDINFTLLP